MARRWVVVGNWILLKTDRIGLIVVVASLAAIALIAVVLFQNQHQRQLENIRAQGVSLARTLSGIPYSHLIPGGAQQSVTQLLLNNAGNEDFAYISLTDIEGRSVTEAAASGVTVPPAVLPGEPSAWLGSRDLDLYGRKLTEFYAPLLQDSDLKGFARLGFYQPTLGPSISQLPFIGTVALPIFLLAPLFYLLLRREVRPIREASKEMSRLVNDEKIHRIEIAANGELGEFMRQFNGFVEQARTRMNVLEQDNVRLITSSKLMTYRKSRVEIVLETLPEAVAILDEAGSITFVNQKLAAMLGTTKREMLANPPELWCDQPDILDLLARFESTGKRKNFTETIRFKSGSVYDKSIATKTYPLFSPDSSSSSLGTLIVFRDETRDALAREARVDFVGHLAHELKSPLNVLGLYSESLLGDDGNSKEFRIEAANVISSEVDRLSTLISGLLSLTQIESGSLKPEKSLVIIRDVAVSAFEEAKHSAHGRDIQFNFVSPKELNPAFVDKDLIRIALANLLSNAVKYNRDGGEVVLTIEETDDAVQIRIADSGIGISEAEESKVFEKFFRSDDAGVQAAEGHGLGLALAKQIVELHQGTLSLNRERPEGSEFIINLWKDASEVRQVI